MKILRFVKVILELGRLTKIKLPGKLIVFPGKTIVFPTHPTLLHQKSDPKLSSDFKFLFPAQDKSHLERPADGFPQLLPCSAVHVLKAKMSSNNLLFGTPFICCLELWMEFCATSVGAGVQDLFPEGIEVCKSETDFGGSVGK